MRTCPNRRAGWWRRSRRHTRAAAAGGGRGGRRAERAHAAAQPEPVAQVVPQAVPLQVAVPFATVGHGVHDVVPQVAIDEFETHAPEQT